MDHTHISHDLPLVALSFTAALLSSYTALEMGSRLRRASGNARWIWLAANAVVLGGGIWSMNFIAIMALNVGVPVAYGFNWAALSLALAIAGIALGFYIVTRPNPSRAQQIIAGCVAGLGLAAMPYTGMRAVMFDARFDYNPWIVGVSIVIAMAAAMSALWFALNLATSWRRAGAAVVMALAASGAHVTAMAATSIELLALSGMAEPAARSDLAGAVALGLFFALSLSMVCVFADRRFEFLVDREAQNRRAAQKSLVDSQASIRMLFDNAEQGFLVIDRTLAIGPQYSASCEAIFGQPPAGKNIADMLCPGPGGKGEVMRETLLSVFGDTNAFARELKLELLPKEVVLDGRFIKVAYKGLADPDVLMIILTDVTEATHLAQEVERERMRLEMIVLGFTEGEAFASLVNDYRCFLAEEMRQLASRIGEEAGRSEFYRRLHTFKGLLAQFNFPRSPTAIHDVETALLDSASLSTASALELLKLDRLTDAFDQDMASVSDLLGPGFDAPGGRILVAQTNVRTMEQLARVALIGASSSTVTIPLRMLLQTLTALGRFNAKCILGFHSRCIPTLASRLEKELEPVLVEGDDVTLAPERYGEFFRSLVHVFRNAVDHGIEAPALRVRAGKESAGSIRCLVRDRSGVLEILIADDGAGVDRAALEKKLVASGTREVDVQSMPLSDLVFREGLSSCDAAGQISGRGVGLAAVKAELDRLGGHVSVESELGLGTAFTFTLPYEIENEANDEADKFQRIAV